MYELSIGPLGDWNGTAKVIAKSDNIFREKVDAVCVSVGSTLEHSSAVWKAISKEAGLKEYKAAFVKARDAVGHWLSRGEVLVVNTSATKLSAKFVFLVVHPDIHHLEAAYRSVFREADARQCSSIAIPGLGCGAIGNSIHSTCAMACSVLFETAATGALGSVKVIEFVDIKEEVERQFARELQSKFASAHSDTAVATRSSDGIWKYAKPAEQIQEDDCVICLSALGESKEVCELPCSHQYHVDCFSNYLDSASSKKCCAMCCKYFDLPLGNQPKEARMHVHKDYSLKLPGHEDSEFTYQIIYTVPSGLQDASHIRPGKPFTGTRRVAYVPGSADGSKVLRLLKFAFDRRLIFTVGDSITTGAKNVVVWNNVHHKTNISGGPQKYGYPDPEYLNRVKEDLSAMGITEDMLPAEEHI